MYKILQACGTNRNDSVFAGSHTQKDFVIAPIPSERSRAEAASDAAAQPCPSSSAGKPFDQVRKPVGNSELETS